MRGEGEGKLQGQTVAERHQQNRGTLTRDSGFASAHRRFSDSVVFGSEHERLWAITTLPLDLSRPSLLDLNSTCGFRQVSSHGCQCNDVRGMVRAPRFRRRLNFPDITTRRSLAAPIFSSSLPLPASIFLPLLRYILLPSISRLAFYPRCPTLLFFFPR